ncbi:hypothetical protein WL29_22085 [Burkholderia ubonensis]|uniref:Uncharacterized protein n=1 Tax=Burkholderia ubonensis TaxID=101571 RepID=A0A119HFK9_9BURK|nr:hypothetical protein [Burkholderia ubonensis]KWA84059.1 hypothetical protein WL29_22085 [Burkholderia ubonensis]
MSDFRGLRRQYGSLPSDGATSSVTFFDPMGRLIQKLGDCHADGCIVNQLVLGEKACPALPSRALYAFATVAQGVLEVSQGIHPSFSRRSPCQNLGEERPCLVQVEPYFAGDTVAGAKVTCHHLDAQASTVEC